MYTPQARKVETATRVVLPVPAKSVLIADADPEEGARVRNSLEGAGYDAVAWTRVEDAREALRARSFQLLVFSTNLGDKGMEALLTELRPLKIPPTTVLILNDDEEGSAAERAFLRSVILVNRPFELLSDPK